MTSKIRMLVAGGALLLAATGFDAVAAAADGAAEKALARAASDPSLAWGPCPPFMPASCGLAVLHGDPSRPNADVFFRLAPGTGAPDHWHTSAERMVLVSGEMRVKYHGQEAVVLRPGMYAYGPPKLPHDASCTSSEPCVLFIAFESGVDAFPVEINGK